MNRLNIDDLAKIRDDSAVNCVVQTCYCIGACYCATTTGSALCCIPTTGWLLCAMHSMKNMAISCITFLGAQEKLDNIKKDFERNELHER